jgi:biotin synthase
LSTIQDAPIFNTPLPVQATQSTLLQDAVNASGPRMTWTKEEISQIYNTPLIELQYAAVSYNLQQYSIDV